MTLRELAARIAAFVTRRHGRGDLDDQLQFHREMLEEQLRSQGLTSADAAREARRRIGGPAQIGEAWQDQHSLPWLETLIGDLRFGARMLVRAPGFSLAALFTLTLGIGANTAMFTIVDGREYHFVDEDTSSDSPVVLVRADQRRPVFTSKQGLELRSISGP